MRDLATDWDTGRIGEHDVFTALAASTGLALAVVEAHADARCASVTFHRATWDMVRAHRLPQALVTVNPDLFVRRIVARHALADAFDAIVVSSVEHTADKTQLCEIALERLGYDGPRAAALLVDNRADLCDAWRATGGAAYRYRGDDDFAARFEAVLAGETADQASTR